MDTSKKEQTPEMMVKRSQPRKVNITLLAQTRKMVYDVYSFFKKDAAKQNCIMTENQLISRTSEATQTSMSTIRRILHEAKTTDMFQTPGKKRKRAKPVTDLDRYNKEMVRKSIQNFRKTDKKPTLGRLLVKLQSDINFKGSEASLRRILKDLGIKWKNVDKNGKPLVECAPSEPIPVPVHVEMDPSCYEGITKKPEDKQENDTENDYNTDDLNTDTSDYEDNGTNLINYNNHKTDLINYIGVRIKKENECQQTDSLNNIYVGVTIKRETED